MHRKKKGGVTKVLGGGRGALPGLSHLATPSLVEAMRCGLAFDLGRSGGQIPVCIDGF